MFGKHISKTITLVFSERSDADYNDMKCFEQEEVYKIKSDVRILLDEIQAYLISASIMREKIIEGLNTPLEECLEDSDEK